jgi:hypothetical protein
MVFVFVGVALAVVLAAAAVYVRMTLTATREAQQRHVEDRRVALERLATVAERSLPQRLTPEAAAHLAEQFSQTIESDPHCLDKARAAIAAAPVHQPNSSEQASLRC